MSGRKRPAYDPSKSPGWQLGHEDGTADRARLGENEDAKIQGPTPPHPDYRKMYDRGYEAGFQGE